MGISTRLTKREGRKFAFTVGSAFFVLAAVSMWRGHYYPPRVLAVLGGALLAAGVLVPGRLTAVHNAWMGLGHAISKVTSPIVIGTLYFVIMTPIAVLIRLFGKDPLRHREVNNGFWMPASSNGRSDLETQF